MTQTDEWLDRFTAEVDRIQSNPPPAPPGLELTECDATPRHWPTYTAHVEGMYPATCWGCIDAELSKRDAASRCERSHRRWKSWRIWSRAFRWAYLMGLTASGGGTSFAVCETCDLTVQHIAPRLRGRRRYVLGKSREEWACLRRGHRRAETYYGLCSICCPCPSCGSVNPAHSGDCGGASDE